MLTLAIDTSTREGSVALGIVGGGRRPELLGEQTLRVSATHSETVLPAVDQLLRGGGTDALELEAVVVGAGPGSFTGVRIGAALARGICFPRRSELFAYSSLAAIAAGTGATGPVLALLDARREQVYAAGYAGGEEAFAERLPPRAGALDELLEELDVSEWSFAGVLSGSQRATIERAGGALLAPERGRPSGTGLLRLVHCAPDRGRVKDPAHWEPDYVRVSSAERRVGDF